jgi:D-3-phosphoglycerate dehydrogenase
MVTVVASDAAMIRPETLQSVFGEEVTIETADLGSESDIVEAAANATALIVGVDDQVTEIVIERCEQLQIVARAGVGVDNVDVEAAADHGVTVVNVPEYCTEEVSTHAVSLLLAGVRRLGIYDRAVERGQWSWQDGQPIHRLSTKTVGFHSFGQLAKRTAEKLASFECDLIAADPYVESEEMADYGVDKVSLDELFSHADHISIHAPLTDETRHLFDRDAFEQMSDTAVLVNVARGPIVDEEALRWALENGEIAAAGLDVLESESPEESPLAERDDVIMTPHAAFYSEESVTDLNEHLARDIQAVFDGQEPEGLIAPEGN